MASSKAITLPTGADRERSASSAVSMMGWSRLVVILLELTTT